MTVTRRQFIKGTGAAFAAAAISPRLLANNSLPKNRADLVAEIGQLDKPLIATDSEKIIFQASLTKLKDAAILFDHFRDGLISPHDKFRITSQANSELNSHKTGYRGYLTYERGMKVALTASYNDLVYSIGQNISALDIHRDMHQQAKLARGTEWAYHQLFMNPKAKDLGMNNTNYWNSHGLPGRLSGFSGLAHNTSTLSDLARLCEYLVTEHAQFMDYFSIPEINVPNIGKRYNTNRLLENATDPRAKNYKYEGVIGMKTGFYNEAGSCIAEYAIQDGIELIAITTGHPNGTARNNHARQLLDDGFKLALDRKKTNELHKSQLENCDPHESCIIT